jgi:hypothetical protein
MAEIGSAEGVYLLFVSTATALPLTLINIFKTCGLILNYTTLLIYFILLI